MINLIRKLTKREMAKPKPNPIFDNLPKALKDTSCYADIERQVRLATYSDHTHKTLKQFVRCKRCTPKIQARQNILKGFGFAGYAQYLEWRRVMNIIISQQDIPLT